MATMIKEVYDALLEAGASDEKAGKAAEAVASYENRFNRLDSDIAKLDTKVTLVQWMLGLVIVVEVIPLLKNLF